MSRRNYKRGKMMIIIGIILILGTFFLTVIGILIYGLIKILRQGKIIKFQEHVNILNMHTDENLNEILQTELKMQKLMKNKSFIVDQNIKAIKKYHPHSDETLKLKNIDFEPCWDACETSEP